MLLSTGGLVGSSCVEEFRVMKREEYRTTSTMIRTRTAVGGIVRGGNSESSSMLLCLTVGVNPISLSLGASITLLPLNRSKDLKGSQGSTIKDDENIMMTAYSPTQLTSSRMTQVTLEAFLAVASCEAWLVTTPVLMLTARNLHP